MNKSQTEKEKNKELEWIKHFDEKIDRAKDRFDQKVTEAKKEIKKQNWHIFRIVTAIIVTIFGAGWWGIFNDMQTKVQKRLDAEFSAKNIKILIEETAKKHTEDKVEDIVENSIEPFSKEMQKIVNEAKVQLEHLTILTQLKGAANLGDRKSYERLVELASTDNALASTAKIEVLVIQQNLTSLYLKSLSSSPLRMKFPKDGKDVKAENFTTRELFDLVEQKRIPHDHRFYLLFDIVKKPKKEIFSESLRVLRDSDYLPAIVATISVLSNTIGYGPDLFDFDGWIEFLEKQ